MRIQALRSGIMKPPQHDLLAEISASLKVIPERSVFVVTSKVVSIWQGKCIPASEVSDKDALIMRESERYLPRESVPGAWVIHTIKNNLLIPSAGIDESNADGHFILWPDMPYEAAEKILAWIREKYGVKECGVIITDSHSGMLRRGVVGISLGHAGFSALNDYRHTKDLFGRELKVSQANIPDSLAAAAVVAMGEGSECTPFALVTEAEFVRFCGVKCEPKTPEQELFSSFEIPPAEDLYAPFIESVEWKKGGTKSNGN